jgi:two-component system, NtrC family, response regulator HydG
LRELKNVIKRGILLTDGEYVEPHCLPFEISNFSKLLHDPKPFTPEPPSYEPPSPPLSSGGFTPSTSKLNPINLKATSLDAEYEAILEVLKKVNFNKSKAAKILNIDRKTLYNKMKQYNELNNL